MTQLIPLPGCRLVRVARDGPTALTLVAEAKPDWDCPGLMDTEIAFA